MATTNTATGTVTAALGDFAYAKALVGGDIKIDTESGSVVLNQQQATELFAFMKAARKVAR